jgi:hypothetical protein
LSERAFIDRVLEAVNINITEAVGRTKRSEVVRAHEILMVLGVERCSLRVKELASALGVRYDTASLWGRRGPSGEPKTIDSVVSSTKPTPFSHPPSLPNGMTSPHSEKDRIYEPGTFWIDEYNHL